MIEYLLIYFLRALTHRVLPQAMHPAEFTFLLAVGIMNHILKRNRLSRMWYGTNVGFRPIRHITIKQVVHFVSTSIHNKL